MRTPVVHTLFSLSLAGALLIGVAPARAAVDRCMTPFEEEVWLLVNQRRAEGAICGGEYYDPAPDLAAEQMLHNAAKRHSEDMAVRDFVDHVNPDGESMVDRAEAEYYPWWALAENIARERVFKRDEAVAWRCRNCGYVHTGKEAPAECPACAHSQAHFELLAENW